MKDVEREPLSADVRRGQPALGESDCRIDGILVRELAEPGSDQRFGVNLVCRPSRAVRSAVEVVQGHLRQLEPDQYYCPLPDLHMTLVEICHSQTLRTARNIASVLREIEYRKWLPDHSVRLDSPSLVSDNSGCALRFAQPDGPLADLRRRMIAAIEQSGVHICSRYPPASAHITLLRYVAPLRGFLRGPIATPQLITDLSSIQWQVRTAWLTWGANWYGMRHRISEFGPIRLQI